MFKTKQRFSQEERENIGIRNAMIQQKQNELMILTREREVYVIEALNKKGLDPKKKYSWDEKGYISEAPEKK